MLYFVIIGAIGLVGYLFFEARKDVKKMKVLMETKERYKRRKNRAFERSLKVFNNYLSQFDNGKYLEIPEEEITGVILRINKISKFIPVGIDWTYVKSRLLHQFCYVVKRNNIPLYKGEINK